MDMRGADLIKSAHMVANTPQSTPVVRIKNDMIGVSEVSKRMIEVFVWSFSWRIGRKVGR
jgi:hypothetical protein